MLADTSMAQSKTEYVLTLSAHSSEPAPDMAVKFLLTFKKTLTFAIRSYDVVNGNILNLK